VGSHEKFVVLAGIGALLILLGVVTFMGSEPLGGRRGVGSLEVIIGIAAIIYSIYRLFEKQRKDTWGV